MPMQENQPAWLAGEVRMAGILVPQMSMEMLGPSVTSVDVRTGGCPWRGRTLTYVHQVSTDPPAAM